ncbi:hypothetical protein DSECCO2_120140 [anaerobic digester metagenome]
MAEFIGYTNTLDIAKNSAIFIDLYGDAIFELHRKQYDEEVKNGYSYKQYYVQQYHAAFEYCVNLFFLTLERLDNQTLEESEKAVKLAYSFAAIQENLAHEGIDLDSIFDAIRINYIPVSL